VDTKKEIIRFFIAGAIANVTDYSIYFFLFHFLPFSVAKGISFAGAGITGYLLNKYWVLRQNQPSYIEAVRYALIIFLALGINVLVNQTVLNLLPGAVVLALIVASMLAGSLAFVCLKWWVFRAE